MKNIELYLSRTIIAGILLLLFMPFIVANSMYFPFVAGKGFYFRIIVEILVLLYLILVAINPVWRPRKNGLYWVFGLLLVFLFISNILSLNSYKSFFSNFERMEGYIHIVHLIPFFIVTHSVIIRKKVWDIVLITSIGVSVLVAGYVVLQLGGALTINQGGVRVDGPFGNAAYLAMYSLVHIFLACFYVLQKKYSTIIKTLFGLVALANLFVLYQTQTRGAILGFLGGLLLVAIIIAWKKREVKKARKIALGLITAILLFITVFVSIKDTSFVRENQTLNRFASISLTETTTQSRFTIWGMAIEGIKEKPVFGWGQESFNYVFNKYYNPVLYAQEQWFDRSHSIFFDWLIAGGVLGGGAYLSLFVFAIYFIWKREDFDVYQKAALIGLISSYFFQNLFVFDNPTSYMLFFLLLAFVSSRESQDEERGSLDVVSISKNSKIMAGTIGVILVITGSYVFSIKPLLANTSLISGLQSYGDFMSYRTIMQNLAVTPGGTAITRGQIPSLLENGQISGDVKNVLSQFRFGDENELLITIFENAALDSAKRVEEKLKYSLDLNTFATGETREQIAAAVTQLMNNAQFPVNLKASFRLFAREQLLAHSESAPKDARNQMLVGATFRQLGDSELGIKLLKQAIENSPNKQTILLELGTAYLQIGDLEHTLSTWRKAYELDKNFIEAKIAYASALIYAGQDNEGQELIEEVKLLPYGERLVYKSPVLIHVYTLVNDLESLRELWIWRINQNPNDINARIALAATYFELGQKQKAINTIEEAISIDPNFTTIGTQYIEEIKAGRRPQ